MSLVHSLGLEIVPLELALPHERHDPRRVAALVDRIRAEGKLVNPPIATRFDGKYIILDGATRLAAFQWLKVPHIILQVVDPYAQQVQLHLWHHLVRGAPAPELVQTLAALPGITVTPVSPAGQPGDPLPAQALGCLHTPSGDAYLLQPTGDAHEPARLALLNRIVEAYSSWGAVERTLATDPELLSIQYPDWAGLMVLPRFTVEAVLAFATQGYTIPAGITRFLIPGRVLRVNAPLAQLASGAPLEEKQRWLEEMLAARLADRQVRYYEEPVMLLDD